MDLLRFLRCHLSSTSRLAYKAFEEIITLGTRGELHFEIQDEGINAEDFIAFCEKLINDVGRPVFIILDNSHVHHAKIVKQFAADSDGKLTLLLPPALLTRA
jgi:hypothetical protein